MISHKHKCIFIHIPKTAGTSINSFFHPGVSFHFEKPDYDRLFGWCPERKLHMQHATAKQLLETQLVTQEQWNSYYKFVFVRNPWDRAYSDYIWIKKFANIEGTFKEYITKQASFKEIFTDTSKSSYLGDHLLSQSSFFDFDGAYKLDFVGTFENFADDIKTVLINLSIKGEFNVYNNRTKRYKDYSLFYTNSNKKLVEEKYKDDIALFGYKFIDNRRGFNLIKKLL